MSVVTKAPTVHNAETPTAHAAATTSAAQDDMIRILRHKSAHTLVFEYQHAAPRVLHVRVRGAAKAKVQEVDALLAKLSHLLSCGADYRPNDRPDSGTMWIFDLQEAGATNIAAYLASLD